MLVLCYTPRLIVEDDMSRLVYGVGLNDQTYAAKQEDGTYDKSYKLWVGMLERCYSKTLHIKYPAYAHCSVYGEFKHYTYFREWCCVQEGYKRQDSNGRYYQLDKDILVKGNKVYSEDTCIFIPPALNLILIKNDAIRGQYPVGIHKQTIGDKYIVHAPDENGKRVYCGSFVTVEEAFLTYKKLKESWIRKLTESYKGSIDNRAYEALMNYQVEITD
jgi:hypothetical protein